MEYWAKTNAPSASGDYILCSTPGFTWEVIYVGDADDIKKKLLDHLNGDIPCITQTSPTAFMFELADAARRTERRDELIGEYSPTCN